MKGSAYLKENNLNNAVKKAKKEYYKAWRSANRDKIKQYNQRYWEKRVKDTLSDGTFNE